ncbi:ATP-dependent metallopeptidase FtsH/Yme1/Tma family protein [Cyanobacteria bacterium FACHB-471]|nr:ATP-dependent metallopeptidase FtsH/Yme1/Tma family protein [Cyanobacteria bacterium FACHB-471]
MPIRENPTPTRRFSNVFLVLSGLFLIANFIVPLFFRPQIPGVPYSLFIHQVQTGEVERVEVGQKQIRFQLKPDTEEAGIPGTVFSTTPIFDLNLPNLLEEKGVEFAAAPPPRNGWVTNLLGWVIPPLIFVAIWQFFGRRGGGQQGMLSIQLVAGFV